MGRAGRRRGFMSANDRLYYSTETVSQDDIEFCAVTADLDSWAWKNRELARAIVENRATVVVSNKDLDSV